MHSQILLAFLLYFSILLALGLIFHKKQTSAAGFILGNRSLTYWLTALSAHASDMSAWLFMAYPASIFLGGIPHGWTAIGLMVGMLLNWQLVARRLRIATEKYDSYTLSTFFERRFQDNSGIIRILTAAMSIVFLTCYISSGLIAMGYLFESIFHIDYYIGLTLAMLVVVVYTFFGGFVTVAWTDLFQAVFLLLMILIVPLVAINVLPNGFQSILEAAKESSLSLQPLPDYSVDSFIVIISLVLGWGLGYFGQPHIVTKFMGIRDAEEINKSKYVGMSWQIVALLAATLVGLVAIAYFKNGVDNPELVFVEMVKQLFPPFIAGFILCGVIAANMSTMDSQVLVCASVLCEDFYHYLFKRKSSPEQLLFISRMGVILVAIISLLIAFRKSATVLESVLYAWSGLGCSFGPLVLVALYSKRANKYGAIAGILVGGIIAGTWSMLNPYVLSYTLPGMIPGFFLSLASIFLVSWLTRNADNPHIHVLAPEAKADKS